MSSLAISPSNSSENLFKQFILEDPEFATRLHNLEAQPVVVKSHPTLLGHRVLQYAEKAASITLLAVYSLGVFDQLSAETVGLSLMCLDSFVTLSEVCRGGLSLPEAGVSLIVGNTFGLSTAYRIMPIEYSGFGHALKVALLPPKEARNKTENLLN